MTRISNKYISRDTTYNDLKLHSISKEQCTRPDRYDINQIITKKLSIGHHESRQLFVSMKNSDLVRCYNSILYISTALNLLRIRMPHDRIYFMVASIERMMYRIIIVFGYSDPTCGGDDIED